MGYNNFDLGKTEVQSFLISNALFWLDVYHVDGLRVGAVCFHALLGLRQGTWEWNPNSKEEENLEGLAFSANLMKLSLRFRGLDDGEESTAWPMVTMPTYLGDWGLIISGIWVG